MIQQNSILFFAQEPIEPSPAFEVAMSEEFLRCSKEFFPEYFSLYEAVSFLRMLLMR